MAFQDAREIDVRSRVDDKDFDLWLQKNLEIIRELLSYSPWVVPTLLAGWTEVGGVDDEPLGYRVSGLHVLYLRGYLEGGTTADGTVILNVPAPYRSDKTIRIGSVYVTGASEDAFQLEFRTNGDVAIYSVLGTSAKLSLHAAVFLDN